MRSFHSSNLNFNIYNQTSHHLLSSFIVFDCVLYSKGLDGSTVKVKNAKYAAGIYGTNKLGTQITPLKTGHSGGKQTVSQNIIKMLNIRDVLMWSVVTNSLCIKKYNKVVTVSFKMHLLLQFVVQKPDF